MTTPATTNSNSIFKDKLTGLKWTRGTSTANHGWDEANDPGNGAIEYCANLNHGGINAGSWRLPTQKELIAAYEHGIYDLNTNYTAPDNLGDMWNYFWSSTTLAVDGTYAMSVALDWGYSVEFNHKTSSIWVLCVAD